MKLKKGDKIKVTVGKDRGKEGTVDRVWQATNKVTVGGVNIGKRHTKARGGQGQKGGILEFVRPLPTANVALICPKCKQPTRVGYKLNTRSAQGRPISGWKKVRVCQKCQQEI